MKLYKYLSVILCTFLLVSCQKELDVITNSTGTTTPGGGSIGTSTGDPNGLLIKSVSKGATDSTVTEYSYDAAKKLINMKVYGTPVGGMSINTNTTYVRDASAIITKIIQKSEFMLASGVDSSVSVIHYDAVNKRYSSRIGEISLGGFLSYHDSTIYVYDAAGKVSQTLTYQEDYITGKYSPSMRSDYTYTGTNVTTMKMYNYDMAINSYALMVTYTFGYDAKVSPMKLGIDAPLILEAGTEGTNNIVSTVATSSTPAANFTIGFVFTYNSANKPATAVQTQSSPASVKNVVFHYQ